MKRIAFIAAVVVAVLAAVWFFSRPEPVAVTVVTAERGPVAATVSNTRAGTVDACRRAGLSPALGGQIASLPVKDGDRVDARADVECRLAMDASERDGARRARAPRGMLGR
jgi:HlyD family secretion protein